MYWVPITVALLDLDWLPLHPPLRSVLDRQHIKNHLKCCCNSGYQKVVLFHHRRLVVVELNRKKLPTALQNNNSNTSNMTWKAGISRYLPAMRFFACPESPSSIGVRWACVCLSSISNYCLLVCLLACSAEVAFGKDGDVTSYINGGPSCSFEIQFRFIVSVVSSWFLF